MEGRLLSVTKGCFGEVRVIWRTGLHVQGVGLWCIGIVFGERCQLSFVPTMRWGGTKLCVSDRDIVEWRCWSSGGRAFLGLVCE